MYIVKANGNLNVLINDIGVRFSSIAHPDGVPVSKEQYESSADLKRLVDAKLITVIESSKVKKEAAVESVSKNTEEQTIFVKEGYSIVVPENVFIAQPQEEVVESTTEAVIENVENANLANVTEEIEVQTETSLQEEVTEASELSDTNKVSRRNNNKRVNK